MSDFTQHEIGLMCRSSWLLEQQLKAELELTKGLTAEFTHKAHIVVDGVDYFVEFRAIKTDVHCRAQFRD